MTKRGEITVFLSLVIVCILSLCMGLLESARTAGARLYAQMAAESAVTSVMSQYNRNLWDMYHLLFLEAESEAAIEQSFSEYMNFYLDQENLYPMKLDEVTVTGKKKMADAGGRWLEDGALSYVNDRLPDVAGDLIGIAEDAEQAAKAGNFRELFEVCRDTGKKTRKLERCRLEIDKSLSDMRELLADLQDAADSEMGDRFESLADRLGREMRNYSGLVDRYEAEVKKIAEHRAELHVKNQSGFIENLQGNLQAGFQNEMDHEAVENSEGDISDHMSQELLAYEQVENAAREQLVKFRELEPVMEENLALLDEALEILEEERYEYVYVGSSVGGSGGIGGADGGNSDGVNGTGNASSGGDVENHGTSGSSDEYELGPVGPDWDAIRSVVSQLQIPGDSSNREIDKEKASMLDRLEELFQGELLSLVLPKGTEVSRRNVSLSGIPSKNATKKAESSSVIEKILVNEYCFLSFDSFLGQCSGKTESEKQALLYEQEYLLCGESSDRENLAETVERLLTVRGAMNLLGLLNSPKKQTEADALAIAVSGGNAPVKFILSFFILTMWAFGEAVLDVRLLLSGESVPFWKQENQWKVDLEALLSLSFLEQTQVKGEEKGSDYKDHMRILFFLMEEETRNFRMMDVIQWNVRAVQEDFAVTDCICEVDVSAEISERHVFLMKNAYTRTVDAVGSY